MWCWADGCYNKNCTAFVTIEVAYFWWCDIQTNFTADILLVIIGKVTSWNKFWLCSFQVRAQSACITMDLTLNTCCRSSIFPTGTIKQIHLNIWSKIQIQISTHSPNDSNNTHRARWAHPCCRAAWFSFPTLRTWCSIFWLQIIIYENDSLLQALPFTTLCNKFRNFATQHFDTITSNSWFW